MDSRMSWIFICVVLLGVALSNSDGQNAGSSCRTFDWQCGDGSCIPSILRCDGVDHCGDGSDEIHCRSVRSVEGSCVVPDFPNDKTYLVLSSDKKNAKPGDRYDNIFINVTCPEGYGVNGSSQFFCIGGQWGPSSQISQCVRQCFLPPNPAVEYQCLLTGSNFGLRPCNTYELEGTEVVPTCRSPIYYAPINLRYMKCLNGNWLHQPLCIPDCGTVTPAGNQLVIGGKAARRGEVPWHVGIYDKDWTPYIQICGGSLISTQIVLSAAHCFWDSRHQPTDRYAVAGGKLYRPWDDSHDDAQKSDVKELHLSDHYKGSTTHHQDDIAVILLKTRFEYKLHVRPVCLDFNNIFQSTQLVLGKKGKIAGWGLTSANGTSSPVLQAIDLPYVGIDTCFADSPLEFHPYLTSDKFCAGYKDGGKTVCQGDSGGGLAFAGTHLGNTERFFLRGITSTASNSLDVVCNPNTYTAFTLVQKHEHFIKRYWVGEDNSWESGGSDPSVQANCVMPYSTNITTYKAINLPQAAEGGAYSSINIEVTCAKGHSLENFDKDSRFGCYNGTWWPTQKLPECTALCGIPKAVGTIYNCPNTIPDYGYVESECANDTFVTSGTVIHKQCSGSYKLEAFGPNTRVCQNGNWTNHNNTRCIGVCRKQRLLGSGQFSTWHTGGRGSWNAPIYSKESVPYQHVCEGTVIAERLVLSAASCFWSDNKQKSAMNFAVAVAKVHSSWDHATDAGWVQKFDVEAIYIPEYYKTNTEKYSDDISVLLLSNDIQYRVDVTPACLDFALMGRIENTKVGKLVTVDKEEKFQEVDIPNGQVEHCLADPPSKYGHSICVNNTANTLCESTVGAGWVFPMENRWEGIEEFFVKGVALRKNDCSSDYTVFTRLQDMHRTFFYELFRNHSALVDTIQGLYRGTCNKAGMAAESTENLKRRKYSDLDSGYLFVPFGVETLGPWGPSAHSLYKDLAKQLVEATRDRNAGLYFAQRISIAIQRGNAASILGTLPTGSGLID